MATVRIFAMILLVVALVGYVGWMLRVEKKKDKAENKLTEEYSEALSNGRGSLAVQVGLVLGGVALLVGGAELLVRGAPSSGRRERMRAAEFHGRNLGYDPTSATRSYIWRAV